MKSVVVELSERESGHLRCDDADPRWQLVERIVATPAFLKANRLQALLRYIVECSIHGDPEQLSESHIGQRVFDKGLDYSPLTDSSVRVQARQLRLKLHEYFDGPGRDELLILEIPKGSYAPNFRPAKFPTYEIEPPVEHLVDNSLPLETKRDFRLLPWALVGVLTVLCGYFAWSLHIYKSRTVSMTWPLLSVFEDHQPTRLILADSTYQIISTATGKPAPLDEYLRIRGRDQNAIQPSERWTSGFSTLFGVGPLRLTLTRCWFLRYPALPRETMSQWT
jgi:hypothetical protein